MKKLFNTISISQIVKGAVTFSADDLCVEPELEQYGPVVALKLIVSGDGINTMEVKTHITGNDQLTPDDVKLNATTSVKALGSKTKVTIDIDIEVDDSKLIIRAEPQPAVQQATSFHGNSFTRVGQKPVEQPTNGQKRPENRVIKQGKPVHVISKEKDQEEIKKILNGMTDQNVAARLETWLINNPGFSSKQPTGPIAAEQLVSIQDAIAGAITSGTLTASKLEKLLALRGEDVTSFIKEDQMEQIIASEKWLDPTFTKFGKDKLNSQRFTYILLAICAGWFDMPVTACSHSAMRHYAGAYNGREEFNHQSQPMVSLNDLLGDLS